MDQSYSFLFKVDQVKWITELPVVWRHFRNWDKVIILNNTDCINMNFILLNFKLMTIDNV